MHHIWSTMKPTQVAHVTTGSNYTAFKTRVCVCVCVCVCWLHARVCILLYCTVHCTSSAHTHHPASTVANLEGLDSDGNWWLSLIPCSLVHRSKLPWGGWRGRGRVGMSTWIHTKACTPGKGFGILSPQKWDVNHMNSHIRGE